MSNNRNIADIFSKSTAISTDAEVSTAVVTERTTVATLTGKTLLSPAMTNIIVTPTSTTGTPITINGIASQSADYLNINTLTTGGTNIVKIDVNGNLGLGATPVAKLHVNGGIRQTGATVPFEWTVNPADGGGQIYHNGATGNRLEFNGNGIAAPAFTTRSAGTKIVLFPNVAATTADFAIGIESANIWQSVPNSTAGFKWYAGQTNIGTLSGTGTFTVTGNITAYSDERLKSNIKTIKNALKKVYKLRGVSFDKDGESGIGVIAQEVQEILPEVVQDGEYLSVAYGNIVGLLIEAIKEQQSQIEDLKSRLA